MLLNLQKQKNWCTKSKSKTPRSLGSFFSSDEIGMQCAMKSFVTNTFFPLQEVAGLDKFTPLDYAAILKRRIHW